MINHVARIAINDLRIYFSQRSNLIGLVLIPVALTLVLGFAFGNENAPARIRVDVVDLDRSELSAKFIHDLRATNDTLVLCPFDNDADDFCRLDGTELDIERGIERSQNRQANALFVIPAGFAAAVERFDEITISYYSIEDALLPGGILQSANAVLERLNGAMVASQIGTSIGDNFTEEIGSIFRNEEDRVAFSRNLYDRAQKLWAEQPVTVSYALTGGEQPPDLSQTQGFGQSVPGMGSMYALFTVLGGMVLLISERRQWTLQRLVVMPLKKSEILGGKILAYFLLGMIQMLVVFMVGFFTGVNFGQSPVAILLIAVAYVLCITALTFALGARVTNEAQARGLITLLGLSLAPLGGAWFPSEIMPKFMQMVGRISPMSWAMEGFREVIFFKGGLYGIVLIDIGILALAAIILFLIGIRGFRYE